jgi:hypothetical protein
VGGGVPGTAGRALEAREDAGEAAAPPVGSHADLGFETLEAQEVFRTLHRALDAGARHLQAVGAGHRLLDVELGGERAADPRAVRHRDAAWLVDEQPEGEAAGLRREVDAHEVAPEPTHRRLREGADAGALGFECGEVHGRPGERGRDAARRGPPETKKGGADGPLLPVAGGVVSAA